MSSTSEGKETRELSFHYPSDERFSRDEKFMAWMSDLERIMVDFGAKHEGHPYGGPLVESTGLECWFDYYDNGFSPQAAFDEDRTYWD